MNTGFREMLRDRCPEIVSLALKWCKAKEKWLDYVYKEQIWILASKEERYKQTKLILGIKDGKKNFVFHDTIVWEGLSADEAKYWKFVEDWVNFFVRKHAYIEDTYVSSKKSGCSIEQCKLNIMNTHLKQFCPTTTDTPEEAEKKSDFVNRLTDYLIDSFGV